MPSPAARSAAARRVLVIVNPRAGRGRALTVVTEVETELRRTGFSVRTVLTARPGHAIDLAAAARTDGDYAAVLALGGDGTLHECANGLLRDGPCPDGPALVPLALGTGNSFVRDFGLSSGKWRHALQRLADGHQQVIDAARANWYEGGQAQSGYFVNVFGTGFMASVAALTNRRLKVLGGSGYNVAVLWQLARLTAPDTRILIESLSGELTTRKSPLTLVGICNTQWTGETMWIAPQASASDGLLDVLTLGRVSRLELIRLFPRIFSGTHLSHHAVTYDKARSVTIEQSVPSPLLMDGEVGGVTPVTVAVVPGALTVAL